MSLHTTTWQTVGPFFRIGLERLYEADIAGANVKGERVAIQGRIVDGDGKPIPDAVVEIWQANAAGRYAHPADTRDIALESTFVGFGRIPTSDDGTFRFTTIKPGPVPGVEGTLQAPHLVVGLMMRGLLRGLVTRAYFPNDALNATDAVLQSIDADRRETIILKTSIDHPNLLSWEIHMQGHRETVFLDF